MCHERLTPYEDQGSGIQDINWPKIIITHCCPKTTQCKALAVVHVALRERVNGNV